MGGGEDPGQCIRRATVLAVREERSLGTAKQSQWRGVDGWRGSNPRKTIQQELEVVVDSGCVVCG